ncbi:MAG TPA: Wzz/FepE/Etk N-terminal domain-containing protein, partial [Rhabdaerophilum sp.]|nr:Wzz/FepE/Etk N-terminal domain-containing protein [Rhabdaerophilum sp.]
MDATETTAPARAPAISQGTHQSVGSVAGALWRKKFWIVIPTLIALLASLAVVNILTPRYTGEARVLLENRETVYSRPDRDTGAGSTSIDPEAVASQVQNVMSKDLALKIIREMELYKREEYDPVQKGLGISGQI